MKVRRVKFAFVSAAFLAAFATSCGAAFASPASENSAIARKAYAALQAGDAQGAVANFSEAIESRALEPEMLANALLNRALAYQQLGQHEKAIDDYGSALSLDAMAPLLRATALYNRGLSQQKLGRIPTAIEDFTGALLLNPEFSHAFYSRGNALRDSGQLLFALSDYERALRYQYPDTSRVHYGAAMTYIALHRPQDAKRALDAALEINPDYAAAREQLAKLGDAAAEADSAQASSDPILTGSVAALSGGTVARKLVTPEAVDVPAELGGEQLASAPTEPKRKKLYYDQVPAVENASYAAAEEAVALDEGERVVAIEEVPEIPAPGEATETETATDAPPVESPPVTSEEQPDEAPGADVAAATEEQPAEAAPVAEQPVNSGWVVQVASAVNEDAAWSTWKKLQKRYKVLQNEKPIVVKADLGTKGTFYRVRLPGFSAQSEAKQACAKLKANGVSCYISKS